MAENPPDSESNLSRWVAEHPYFTIMIGTVGAGIGLILLMVLYVWFSMLS